MGVLHPVPHPLSAFGPDGTTGTSVTARGRLDGLR